MQEAGFAHPSGVHPVFSGTRVVRFPMFDVSFVPRALWFLFFFCIICCLVQGFLLIFTHPVLLVLSQIKICRPKKKILANSISECLVCCLVLFRAQF